MTRTKKHLTSVDQSDRKVPYNLRQSGGAEMQMLMWNKVRKSPFWHLAVRHGAWRATVYNRMYHPFGYVRHEDGGPMVEYRALVDDVTLWDVAVERQIQVKGRQAVEFVDYVITRDASKISPMMARYVVLCNQYGGVLNDPVLLRVGEDEFWFSLSDSDIGMYLQAVNHDNRFAVRIDEIDVCPLQIQGPKSAALVQDLVGAQVAVADIPFYGLAEVRVAGHRCVISQTGFSGESGYEIYLRDATLHAEDVWEAIIRAGRAHRLRVTAPSHCRRIQAGILSWGQDMDQQHNPYQCNLGYQVSLSAIGAWDKPGDYIGRRALENIAAQLRGGHKPYKLQLVGLEFGGKPVLDYAADFWPIAPIDDRPPVGFVTSPWYHPTRKVNIAMGYVPFEGHLTDNGFPTGPLGKRFLVHLPQRYRRQQSREEAVVVRMPFTASNNANTRELMGG